MTLFSLSDSTIRSRKVPLLHSNRLTVSSVLASIVTTHGPLGWPAFDLSAFQKLLPPTYFRLSTPQFDE